ncbi:hypothetical protein AHAS_Ahas15G0203000 [Arachis hypogaea]
MKLGLNYLACHTLHLTWPCVLGAWRVSCTLFLSLACDTLPSLALCTLKACVGDTLPLPGVQYATYCGLSLNASSRACARDTPPSCGI